MSGSDRTPEDRRREEERRRKRREAEQEKQRKKKREAELRQQRQKQRQDEDRERRSRRRVSAGPDQEAEGRPRRQSSENRTREKTATARDPAATRRRLLLLLVPFALLAVIILAIGGGDDKPEKKAPSGPTAQEKRAARARQLARQRDREDEAIHRLLNSTTYIKNGGAKRREVALTFDDGPGEKTEEILDILRRTRTPATFFVVGTSIPDHEETLHRTLREGHAIGNHTQEHAAMASLDPQAQGEQILKQEEAIEKAGVKQRSLFRPPYRSFDRETLNLLRERDDLMVLWSVDTNDYANPGSDAIARTAVDEAEPGSIILMHDAGGDRQQTVDALPQIIKGLKQKGLKPVTVPQMVRTDPPANPDRYPEGL